MTLSRRTLLGRSLLLGAALCSPRMAFAGGVAHLEGPAFGGMWRVVLPAPGDAAVAGLVQGIVAQVDASMSPWRPDSEISRFNAGRDTGLTAMSPPLCAVLGESLAVSALTGGAFDPTVGPSVARFGFGPISRGGGRLSDLVLGQGGARKAAADLTLDLCGIAKGHALDLMVAALTNAGLCDFLIELGGEVRARGAHPEGRPWTAGIEVPGSRLVSFQRIVAPGDLALATSGTRINGYSDAARAISHIIDPRTARPVGAEVASVSVLAASAARADALATALTVLGPVEGPALAAREGIAALFLTGTGELRETMTGAFADHVLA